MPTEVHSSAGPEKRRQQNRLAQRRFRQKRRQQKDSEQYASTLPSTTLEDDDQQLSCEDNTLTRFLASPDFNHLDTAGWSIDYDSHEGAADTVSDINLDNISQTLDIPPQSRGSTSENSGTILDCYDPKQPFLDLNSGENTINLDLQPSHDPESLWQPPLHIAAQKGHMKIVQLLLGHKADCNQKDSQGLTAVMHATINGHDEIADYLLLHGASIQCVNNQGRSALHLAVLHHRDRLLRRLLQHCKNDNAVVNGYSKDGKTPLHLAIDMGQEAAVEMLLKSGADVHYKARTSTSGASGPNCFCSYAEMT